MSNHTTYISHITYIRVITLLLLKIMLYAFLRLSIDEVFQIKTSSVCLTTFQLSRFSKMNGYNPIE